MNFKIKPNVRLEQSDNRAIMIDDIHGEFYECNDSALFMIRELFKGSTKEDLVSAIINKYEISINDAYSEVEECLKCLNYIGILKNEE